MRERLSTAESVLTAAVAAGDEADLGRDIDPRSAPDASVWDHGRTVRAHVLEQLLRGGERSHGAAVRLTGVRITGGLRLHYGRLTRPLRLDLCWIDDIVSLVDLVTAGIELVRCRVRAVRAESVDVEGAFAMRECATGSVVMVDTRVHRSASFEDSRIVGEGETTPFIARNLVVGGDLLLNRARVFAQQDEAVHIERLRVESGLGLVGLRARGGVVLSGASVGGRVDATDAVLRNGSQTAFDAQHLVAAGLRARDLRCTGRFDLRHATIAGSVCFDGARLANPTGDALLAGDIEADRFEAEDGARILGRMSLPRGVVRDTLALRGVEIRNPGRQAVLATGASIGALVADGALFSGRVVFDEVEATSVRLTDVTVRNADDAMSISFQAATIRRDLNGSNLRCHGTLDIKGVRVGAAIFLGGAHLDGGGGGRALAASRCVVGERFVLGAGSFAHGDLDLAHADIGKSLAIDGAAVRGTIRLFQARVRSDVLLRGTYIEAPGIGVDAIGLRVDGRFTARGMVCDGGVRLTAAVADAVVLTGAQIHNPGANALIASRLEVRGDLIIGDDPYSRDKGGFRASGRAVLRDARVGGDLIFDGAVLSRPGHRALDVTSIHVGGKISLERTVVHGTAALDKAHVLRRIVVSNAEFTGHGVGSADGPVVLSALQTISDELLVDGGRFAGVLRLTGSSFAVGASIRGASITAPGGVALLGADLTCGILRLTDLDVSGEVTLTGGQIGSDFVVEGGRYRNPGLPAFDASQMVVAGTASVSDVQLVGTLLLRRATVGFAVLMTSVRVAVGTDPNGSRSPTEGLAVAAAGLQVEGNIECRELVTVGLVSFRDAVVTGRLIMRGGCMLRNPGRTALYAPGLRVAGAVELGHHDADDSDDVAVVGDVRLDRVHVGEIWFHSVSVEAARGSVRSGDGVADPDDPVVTLGDAEVSRRLSLDGLDVLEPAGGGDPGTIDLSGIRAGSVELPQGEAAIDLRDGEVRSLLLDLTDPTTVLLSGLSFDDPGGADVDTALAWLRRDPTGYQHQAYEQLAAHYRRLGAEADARTVLLARQRHRRDLLRSSSFGQILTKGWGYLQDATVGYGYRPGLAAVWFVGLLAVGTLYFWGRSIAPVEVGVHPTFNPFGYTLDLLIPLVSLGQDLAWDPTGADLVVAYGLIFAGAVLATTILAAVTRVLNRR
ncbi:MAG TPA: hypothetical protein VIP77_02155 [Jiangellaceae bacterium]